jgi:hypothetical protein
LENSINSIQSFYKIHWPVWKIRQHYSINGGLVTDSSGKRILDLLDKTLPFPIRRLKLTEQKEYSVYPLRKPIWSLKDLLVEKILCFIDYEGNIYHHKKTTYYPLIYKKILERKYSTNTTIFKLKDINPIFEIRGLLNAEATYAGILEIGRGYLLYEVTNTKLKDTKRKI